MINTPLTTKIREDDWISIYNAIRHLASSKLGPTSSPEFVTVVLTGITANTIPYMSATVLADSPLTTDGTDVTCSGYLDLTNITDSNIPYMSSDGFADSPLTTDATDVDCSGNFDLNDNEIQNLVIHPVADSTAREALTQTVGQICYQTDEGILYLYTSY